MAAAAAAALAASSSSSRRKEEAPRRPAHLDLSGDTRITSAQLLNAKLSVKKEGFFSSTAVTPLSPGGGEEVWLAAHPDRAKALHCNAPNANERCTPRLRVRSQPGI